MSERQRNSWLEKPSNQVFNPLDARARKEKMSLEVFYFSVLKVKLLKRLFAAGDAILNVFGVNLRESLFYELLCVEVLVVD